MGNLELSFNTEGLVVTFLICFLFLGAMFSYILFFLAIEDKRVIKIKGVIMGLFPLGYLFYLALEAMETLKKNK